MSVKVSILGANDFSKVVGEVLRSLKVDAAGFEGLEIFNEVIGRKVITRLKVTAGGATGYLRRSSLARPDERFGAEVNRLVKKNLYQLLVDSCGLDPVPYGILHGVRPTKIIQRWVGEGYGVTSHGVLDRDKIVRRVCSDFLTARDKAELLTEVALSQLPIINASDARTVSVYVGIPFCKTRCLYCSFPSNVLPAEEVIASFMTALTRDVEAAADSISRYGFKVQTIYIGGGTPTALPEKFFAEMLETVHKNFYGASVTEFTVECGRPDTITDGKIETMKRFGVTRVSVNPQTMHQRTLDRIGRRHTVEDVTRAFNSLRAANVWRINMDLIIGLPGERLNDFRETLEQILTLAPDDVTIHSLAIKRGSKLQVRLADKLNTLADFNLPEDAEVRQMAAHASKTLRGAGYAPYYLYRQGYMSGQIENVGWCRGSASVYNVQIMGERQTILGVGAAASTKVPDLVNKRIQTAFNAKDLTTYLRDVERYLARREEVLATVYAQADAKDASASDDEKIFAEPVADDSTRRRREAGKRIERGVDVLKDASASDDEKNFAEPIADDSTNRRREEGKRIEQDVDVLKDASASDDEKIFAKPVADDSTNRRREEGKRIEQGVDALKDASASDDEKIFAEPVADDSTNRRREAGNRIERGVDVLKDVSASDDEKNLAKPVADDLTNRRREAGNHIERGVDALTELYETAEAIADAGGGD